MNVTPSFLCLLSTSGVISPLQVSLGLQLICFIRLQQTQDQFQEIIQDHGCFPVANYCCSFWYFVTFILPWNGKEDMWYIECIKDLIYYIFFWTCFEYNAIWCRNMSTLYKQLSFHNFGSMLQILSNYDSFESWRFLSKIMELQVLQRFHSACFSTDAFYNKCSLMEKKIHSSFQRIADRKKQVANV